MSTEKDIYVGLYINISEYIGDDPYETEFLPYLEGHDGLDFDMIYDGMSGNYVYFGKTYGKIEEYGESEDVIISSNIERDKLDILNQLRIHGIDLKVSEYYDKFKHMAFAHYH